MSRSGTTSVQSIETGKHLESNGSLTLTSTSTTSSWAAGSINGELNGPGHLQITGTVTWYNGALTATTVRILPGARFNLNLSSSTRYVGSNTTIVNDGTLYSGGGSGSYSLSLGESFTIQNNAIFEWAPGSNSSIVSSAAAGAIRPQIVNAGTIVKTTYSYDRPISVPVWNQATGVIRADAGILTLNGPSHGNASSGTFAGNVYLSGGSGGQLLAGATFTGSGNRIVSAQLAAGSTSTVPAGTVMTILGSLAGPGRLLVRGTLDWSSGEMSGSATLQTAPEGRLNVPHPTSGGSRSLGSNATIVNDGTLYSWSTSNSYAITLGENFRIQNNGTFEWVPGTGTISSSAPAGGVKPLIVNAGTIVKTSANDRTISVPIWNQGTGIVRSNTGLIVLSGSGAPEPSAGTFAGGVSLGGAHALAGATFSGSGNTLVDVQLVAGTTSIVATGSSTTLAGPLAGAGRLAVEGTLEWGSGGVLNGSDSMYVAPGGRLNLTWVPCCTKRFLGSNSTIVNDGTLSVSSGRGYTLGDGFEIHNYGTIELPFTTAGGEMADASTSTKPLIANAGTLLKLGPYDGNISVPVENDGTIRVDAGALNLNGRFLSFSRTKRVLKEGEYVLKGALRIANLDVLHNAGRITLDGAQAALTATGASASALAGLTHNAGGGRLTLKNGAGLSTFGAFRNAGRLTVEPGSAFTSSGYTQHRGATVVDAATSTLNVGTTAGMTIVSGSLRGTGVVQGNVANAGGTVMPGNAAGPGQLSVQGNYSQGAGGTLALDVAGTTSADKLAVSGAATVGGRFSIATSPSYVPAIGDLFTFMTYGSSTGTFASFTGTGLSGGLAYSLQFQPQSVTAVVQ